MTQLIIFIFSAILLLTSGAKSNEIILKNCYNTYFDSRFDNKTYEFNYYKIDQKNKTISQVWSHTNESWNSKYKFEKGSLRNAVNVYKLDFLDKNFAKGSSVASYSKSDVQVTIDLRTKLVSTEFLFDRPITTHTQCQ